MAAADALIVPQPPSNADLDALGELDLIVKKVRKVNPELAAEDATSETFSCGSCLDPLFTVVLSVDANPHRNKRTVI